MGKRQKRPTRSSLIQTLPEEDRPRAQRLHRWLRRIENARTLVSHRYELCLALGLPALLLASLWTSLLGGIAAAGIYTVAIVLFEWLAVPRLKRCALQKERALVMRLIREAPEYDAILAKFSEIDATARRVRQRYWRRRMSRH